MAATARAPRDNRRLAWVLAAVAVACFATVIAYYGLKP